MYWQAGEGKVSGFDLKAIFIKNLHKCHIFPEIVT